MNQALREYVTRVSFNLSLTRNQIDAFERIVWEIEHWKLLGQSSYSASHNEHAIASVSHFVVAARKLESIGLVVHRDPCEMTPKWSECVWTLTTAGEAVYSLLLEAALIKKPVFSVKAA